VEADEIYGDAVAAFDEALSRAPDYISAHNDKGSARRRRGELLDSLSRYEEAEEAYADAVAAYDEVLSRVPDDLVTHFNNAVTLVQWGETMRPFVQDEVTHSRWEAAQAHCERALALAPQLEQAEHVLAYIRELLDTLEADSF
jgi:tetratricopeptide (TPR) repeat protein